MCCGQVVFFVSAWIIGIVTEQRRRYIRFPQMYNNLYNTCTTVVHIIVIAFQTASPLPAGRLRAFISGFYSGIFPSMMYRPRRLRRRHCNETNLRAPRQWADTRVLYYIIIFDSQTDFSHTLSCTRSRLRKPSRGEYDLSS